MTKKRPFAHFYTFLDKRDRVRFIRDALPILGISKSTFYYKALHGNLLPSEALKLKDVLIKYGATKQQLISMGVLE